MVKRLWLEDIEAVIKRRHGNYEVIAGRQVGKFFASNLMNSIILIKWGNMEGIYITIALDGGISYTNAMEEPSDKDIVNPTVDATSGLRRKMDSKGRLSLPTSLSGLLSKEDRNLVVALSPGSNYICVFELEAFEAWVSSLLFRNYGEFDPTSQVQIGMQAVLMARGVYVERDSNERILISADQREQAKLEAEVVVFKNTDHIEVWNTERWEEHQSNNDPANLMH